MYNVCVEVYERELYKLNGDPVTAEWHYLSQGYLTGPTRLSLFNWCRKQFGRCTGLADMGWTFEKTFVYDDGTKAYVQSWVKIVIGARPPLGFILLEKRT